jgi:multiple sugar transport system permease protein
VANAPLATPATSSPEREAATARHEPPSRFWQRLTFEESLAAYVFLLPWIVGLIGLTLFPMGFSLVMGFYRWDIINPPVYIGLDNYRMLFHDRLFWISLRQTLIYSVMNVPLLLGFGLFLAVLLNQKIKGQGFFRTAFYVPAVIPSVAMILMWIWLLSPDGLINQALGWIGITGPNWFGSTRWAVPALVLTGLWSVGSGMLIYLGGLQGVPTELYEAAELDGASRWRRFWNVTVPMISPIVLYNLVILLVGSMQSFTGSFIATQGGPGYATHFLVYYLYNNAFGYLRMGYASAFAWIVFALILAMTLIVLRWSAAWVYYEGLRSKG